MPYLAGGVGVNPTLGRWFRDAAGDPNGVFLAVISDALWKRLGADSAILGKTIALNDRIYKVLGVMPPCPLTSYLGRDSPTFVLKKRLVPGVGIEPTLPLPGKGF
jgi:hypothetical protein